MKYLKVFLFVALSTVLFIQCQTDDTTLANNGEPSHEFQHNPVFDSILSKEIYDKKLLPLEMNGEKKIECGFDDSHDGEEKQEVSSRENRRHVFLVGQNVSYIDVNVLADCPSDWDLPIQIAVYYMNLVNDHVGGRLTYRFRRLNSNTPWYGDVNIKKVNWGINGTPADAFKPTINGNPGNLIRINADVFDVIPLGWQIIVAVHEIGHTIGFRHTDTSEGYSVGSCSGLDPASIMRSSPQYSLYSSCDLSAYEEMYEN